MLKSFLGVYAIFLPALGVVCFFIPQNYTKSANSRRKWNPSSHVTSRLCYIVSASRIQTFSYSQHDCRTRSGLPAPRKHRSSALPPCTSYLIDHVFAYNKVIAPLEAFNWGNRIE